MLMATRTAIDFHAVEEKHHDIHARLQNWARWLHGSGPPSISPMFRMYRSTARARGAEHTWASNPVDGIDAARIARYITHIPIKHRQAVNWCYVRPVNPRRAAQEIGVTPEGLLLLLRDARQMLVNRRA
jgi:DNA-directed RNA polymerase specialized sigma24 family protein